MAASARLTREAIRTGQTEIPWVIRSVLTDAFTGQTKSHWHSRGDTITGMREFHHSMKYIHPMVDSWVRIPANTAFGEELGAARIASAT